MIDWMCSSSLMALQVKNQHNVWEQCWVPSGNLNNLPLGFPFLDHTNFDDSTLLFCRGQLRNVHSFKMHMPSYCSAHWIFCLVLVAFAVVICSRSLMSVNFQFDTVKIQVNDLVLQWTTRKFSCLLLCLWFSFTETLFFVSEKILLSVGQVRVRICQPDLTIH